MKTKALIITIILALTLAASATAGGPQLRGLIERVGLLEASDNDQDDQLRVLANRVTDAEAMIRCLEQRIDYLTKNSGPLQKHPAPASCGATLSKAGASLNRR